MSVVCALTAQNTQSVRGIYPIHPEFIALQLDAVLEDIGVDAVKIGMMHSPDAIAAVTERLKYYQIQQIVVDPVMVSTCGDKLLRDDAVDALKTFLFPITTVLTPNLMEAAALLQQPLETLIHASDLELRTACKRLTDSGAKTVVLKGGHGISDQCIDLLYTAADDQIRPFKSSRIKTRNTHGTGCTLSAAIAACLGKGYRIDRAVLKSKCYITEALKAGSAYQLGKGHGPVHHFYSFWK